MKIMHFFAHPGYGGSEKYAFRIAREAVANGHEVLFVLGEDGPLVESLKKEKIGFKIIGTESKLILCRYVLGVIRLRKEIKEFQPKVVHTHFLRENLVAAFISKRSPKFLLVRTVHRLDRFNNLAHKITQKIINKKTDYFIAPSEFTAELLRQYHYSPEKIRVIYNGAPALKIGAKADNIIGILSRLEKGKGALELVEKLPDKFNDFQIKIAGDGEGHSDLDKLIETKGLEGVKTLGRVDDLEKFFSEISILAHPSLNESTLPMAVVEALAAGKTAVLFDIEAVKEFEGPGLIKVTPGDWEGLLDKIRRELKQPSFKPEDVKDYYQKNFSTEKLWKKVESLYSQRGL